MKFWEQVFSPGGLAVAAVCSILGVLLGHVLTRTSKRADDKKALILDVAERYRHLREINKTAGIDGLIKSGVCRLNCSAEVEEAIQHIMKYGQTDPLKTIRDRVDVDDIYSFLLHMKDLKLDPGKEDDLQKAIGLIKTKK